MLANLPILNFGYYGPESFYLPQSGPWQYAAPSPYLEMSQAAMNARLRAHQHHVMVMQRRVAQRVRQPANVRFTTQSPASTAYRVDQRDLYALPNHPPTRSVGAGSLYGRDAPAAGGVRYVQSDARSSRKPYGLRTPPAPANPVPAPSSLGALDPAAKSTWTSQPHALNSDSSLQSATAKPIQLPNKCIVMETTQHPQPTDRSSAKTFLSLTKNSILYDQSTLQEIKLALLKGEEWAKEPLQQRLALVTAEAVKKAQRRGIAQAFYSGKQAEFGFHFGESVEGCEACGRLRERMGWDGIGVREMGEVVRGIHERQRNGGP